MKKKDPIFILLMVIFTVLFLTLMSAIIFQTLGILTGDTEQATTTETTAVTEISNDLKEQIETGNPPSYPAAQSDTGEYTGEGDAPEDVEYIRDDLPERERERLDNGTLWEPMDEN